MARDDPQINIRMPADLKAGLEAAAAANNRSVTAEIVARLEQSLLGPKHAPAIIVRLEALPYGTPTQEISLGTFFENLSWTIRASVEALQEARADEQTERSDSSLGPVVDRSDDDEAIVNLAAERFREHVAARRERSKLKRLAKQAEPKSDPKPDE